MKASTNIQNKNSFEKARKYHFSIPELIFVSFMAALNVIFDLFLSPVLIMLLGHIIAGILIMVPLNFVFISLTKQLIDKFGTLLLYMAVFSAISVPTTFYGATPGLYKLLVGVVVGLLLDCMFAIKKPVFLKIVIGGIFGAILWWMGSFLIWTLLKFPYITGMSNLVNNFIDISRLISIPITSINGDFMLFCLVCGLLSSIPCIVLMLTSYPLVLALKKTAIYGKFTSIK
jgi:hypothetical protein